MSDPLVLGNHTFRSRLFVGTGKYSDFKDLPAPLASARSSPRMIPVKPLERSWPPWTARALHELSRELARGPTPPYIDRLQRKPGHSRQAVFVIALSSSKKRGA